MNKGDVIIIPTDTVYGLATRLYDERGLEKIYEMKGRELSKQIPILISDISQLEDIASYDLFTQKVMEIFWPGPLTIVLKTREKFQEKTGEETIAVRIPNHPKALDVLQRFGPMRVTSLNKSGEPPLEDPNMIKEKFGHLVKAIFWQGDVKRSDLSSTVARISENEVEILRQGAITKEDIMSLRTNVITF